MSSIPHPSSPIPAAGRPTRKRSRVMQSSLDLVFSYSRTQQILYGQSLRSTPSFLDVTSTSLSSPSDYGSVRVTSAADLDLERGLGEEGEEDEEEGYEGDGESPVDPVNPSILGDMSLLSADDTGDAEMRTASSPGSFSPVLFPSDPVAAPTRASDSAVEEEGAQRGMPTPRATNSRLFPGSPEGWKPGTKQTNYRITSTSTIGSGSTSRTIRLEPPTSQRGFEEISPTQTPGIDGFIGPNEGTPLIPPGQNIANMSGGGRLRASSGRRSSSARRVSVGELGRRRSSTRMRRASMVRGESTDGQTLFNAVAVLLGIGLLSLPLAFAYAGWVAGTVMLLGFAWLTCHTAKLLARLITADSNMMGYTDIGRVAFGRWGSVLINLLFCLELFALGVALIVLFGDTLQAIFPQMTSDKYKIIGFCLVLPTTLLPLRLLSLPSLLSTLSTILLIIIILVDGFTKTESPGSIIHPVHTDFWPEALNANWLGGIGLVLAGFGGHAVVPSLARDMKFPDHFDRVIDRAFVIAAAVSFIAGSAGYLMIGNGVSDEITRDMLQPKYGYSRTLNLFALWMIVIIPLTKFGLCSRPLNNTVEAILGISPAYSRPAEGSGLSDLSQVITQSRPSSPSSPSDNASSPQSRPARTIGNEQRQQQRRRASSAKRASESDSQLQLPTRRRSSAAGAKDGKGKRIWIWTILSRTIVTVLTTLTAIYIPGFGRVMAFLGSFSAFLICIILPLAFWLRLAPRLVPEYTSQKQRLGHTGLMVVSIGLMIAGTVWTFLPDSGHGGLEE